MHESRRYHLIPHLTNRVQLVFHVRIRARRARHCYNDGRTVGARASVPARSVSQKAANLQTLFHAQGRGVKKNEHERSL